MTLRKLTTNFGHGGAGLDSELHGVLQELRGLTTLIVAGVAANTKINVADLRADQHIVSAIGVSATNGALTDHLSDVAVVDLRASGTLTLGTVVAGNTATVAGKVFTFRAAPALEKSTYEVALGADASEAAANLAAAINTYLGGVATATADANVVTVKAAAEGTTGNATTLVGGANVTASAATLTGGSATGGFKLTVDSTGQNIILTFFKK